MDDPLDDALEAARYSEFYDRSAVPTMTVDHGRRRIIRVNRAALDFLGLDEAEVLGRPAADFLLEQPTDQALRSRAPRDDHTIVVREIRTALGPRTVELHVVASGIEGIAFIQAIDLTDVLDAADRAEARAAELADRSAALETVAARLAHDLLGPMTAIAGMSDAVLLRGAHLAEADRIDMLQRISANAHALVAMTDAIMREASPTGSSPDQGTYQVEDLFAAVRGVLGAQLAEADAVLDTTSSLSELPVPVAAVRQAVINLLSNSIKFREPSRRLVVLLEVRADETTVEIVVGDNGRGLSGDPAQLFDAGRRGQGAATTRGAGLGLAFARTAVERVGGTLTAQPREVGAEFVIRLPATTAAELASPEPAEGDQGAPPLTPAHLERIVDALPLPTIVIDAAIRQIVRVNRSGVRLLGEASEVLGRPAVDFLDGDAVGDALRDLVIAGSGVAHATGVPVHTAAGPRLASLWISTVAGTSLAVAHLLEET